MWFGNETKVRLPAALRSVWLENVRAFAEGSLRELQLQFEETDIEGGFFVSATGHISQTARGVFFRFELVKASFQVVWANPLLEALGVPLRHNKVQLEAILRGAKWVDEEKVYEAATSSAAN